MTEIEIAGKRSEEIRPEDIERGQWYWVKSEERRWLGCVVHVGSNYAQVNAPDGRYSRIHFDKFDANCEREPDADAVIETEIARARTEVNALMGQVKELTARLAIISGPVLGTGSESTALARIGQGESMADYGKALVKAKEETLPGLFKKIEGANKDMAEWMSAKVIPLKAEAESMRSVVEKIEDRIFSVQLYAGLVEELVLCRDGEPAGAGEKVRLLQRRHYMDEECLARYETGGMDFEDILAFDRWISREKNRDRLLPFPKCVVAFMVRREAKEREAANIFEFIRMFQMERADRTTFLYIRNGERVYRMSTEIDFGPKLFPDEAPSNRKDGVWAKIWGMGKVEDIISEGEYLERKRKHKEDERERKKMLAAAPKNEKWRYNNSPWSDLDDYHPFDKSSVHFDDINAKVQGDMKDHNRIALVLQGLLDRSSAFHPHPAWQIWTEEGFRQALELVYDESRALVSGPAPDFEAFRKRLNESIVKGTVTVGQEDAWELHEGEKESRRRDADHRYSSREYRPKRYRPSGNPGPGTLARAAGVTKTKCRYAWSRERLVETWEKGRRPIEVTLEVGKHRLLNVDAYQPGDFRQFFDDPRTRAQYLKWAPMLLLAEEYKAGNRKVGEE